MQTIILDYETFWSQEHTLTKMGSIEYVMHPETEIQSVAIKIGEGSTRVIFGEDSIRKLFAMIDWGDKFVISHNGSEFDHMISAWRFGIKPKMWGCTLAMARPIFAKSAGGSLKAVAAALNCPIQKGNLEEIGTKGKKLADFTREELTQMEQYNTLDTDICHFIFKTLAKQTSARELRLIDLTTRMLVEPQFDLDAPLLEKTLQEERRRKHDALMDVAVSMGTYNCDHTDEEIAEATRAVLASSPKFKAFLEAAGVEVPVKPSPTDPLKYIPALAKTDEGFLKLQEHDNPVIAAAAMARQGVKSTILETRMEKFLSVGAVMKGFPIPLRYYGADTTGRWSGWAFNPQNLPRVTPGTPKSTDALRASLRAPKGYKVVVADLSGIELRVNMFLWKVPYAMELFRKDPAKADLYKTLASQLYSVPIAEITKQQRQMGKVLHLGCGYGVGGAKFKDVAKLMGGIELSMDESKALVAQYRAAHPQITQGWKSCHAALPYIGSEHGAAIDPWKLCYPCVEGIKTPMGMIRYPNLRQEDSDEGKPEWVYGEARHKARIYAGKICENVVQHLAREVIAGHALDFAKTSLGKKYPLALMVHDELVYIVPEYDAQAVLDEVQRVMRTPPSWWPELVVWSEGSYGDTYADAK